MEKEAIRGKLARKIYELACARCEKRTQAEVTDLLEAVNQLIALYNNAPGDGDQVPFLA